MSVRHVSTPAIILAAPASGQGKTIATLGLIRALRRRGLRVGTFKVGPDYIDPGFHARASGRPPCNLDPWAMRLETLIGLVEVAGEDADIIVGEGVMGLFDGAADGSGSTADLAALLGLPVLLLVDCGGMGASIAALVDGFCRHRDDVDVDGIVLNRVAGDGHLTMLRRALVETVSCPIVGHLHRDQRLALPSRHLGLVQAIEHPALETVLDRAATAVTAGFDLDRILRLARSPSITALGAIARPLPPLGQKIAVATDAAFAFAYQAVLEGWRRQGAEMALFSPLADEPPAIDADAVMLPGGYPELHTARLAANHHFLDGLRRAARRQAFVYGECGGYMVLGRTLVDGTGRGHPMADLLPVATSFAVPALHLGYRRIEAACTTPLARAGAELRGHEFHYARETTRVGEPLFRARTADGRDLGPQGVRLGPVAGSFLHLIDRAAPDSSSTAWEGREVMALKDRGR